MASEMVVKLPPPRAVMDSGQGGLLPAGQDGVCCCVNVCGGDGHEECSCKTVVCCILLQHTTKYNQGEKKPGARAGL